MMELTLCPDLPVQVESKLPGNSIDDAIKILPHPPVLLLIIQAVRSQSSIAEQRLHGIDTILLYIFYRPRLILSIEGALLRIHQHATLRTLYQYQSVKIIFFSFFSFCVHTTCQQHQHYCTVQCSVFVFLLLLLLLCQKPKFALICLAFNTNF